jgi:hypothetical protein
MKTLLFCAALLLTASTASASFIVGPGQTPVTNGDQAFNLLAVDLNDPTNLGPGNYIATQFNYQFTDFQGYQTTGTITPVLLIGSGTNYTPIAVGDPVAYNGATAFLSTPFGGNDSFTLASGATVYAGLYWNATDNGGPELRMPVGYENGVGNTFVVFGGGDGPGANPPVVGVPVSGSAGGFGEGVFQRTYDFSIEADPVAAAPEPSSLLLGLTGFCGLVGWRLLRRKQAVTAAENA